MTFPPIPTYLCVMMNESLLQKTLANLGISSLNAMQQTAVPAILNYPNTVLLAPTGSGKTLAFLLPVVSLLQEEVAGVQCLILSPTRELAIQIERVWQQMGTGFKVNTCYGGHAMSIETKNLSQPPALLIGTPGRIQEHLTRNTFDVASIKTLVLDEFDKSLSLGFHEQMGDIIKSLIGVQKRILASATNKLTIPPFTGITNPKVLNYYKAVENTLEGLAVKRVESATEDKTETLFKLLCHIGSEQTLIFCNQRETTEKVCESLYNLGIAASSFHGGMEQPEREKTMVKFRNGSIRFLVASDLAARGLDIPEVKNVVHFELPLKQNDFVHRNGRTARMYAEGAAWLIVRAKETLPAYLHSLPPLVALPTTLSLPEPSPWITLYISGGKKDKLSKTDIVGFLTQKGNVPKDAIGKIEVLDFMTFAAVKKELAEALLKIVQHEKMKGKKYKIVVTN